jgi:hypothetical protein
MTEEGDMGSESRLEVHSVFVLSLLLNVAAILAFAWILLVLWMLTAAAFKGGRGPEVREEDKDDEGWRCKGKG